MKNIIFIIILIIICLSGIPMIVLSDKNKPLLIIGILCVTSPLTITILYSIGGFLKTLSKNNKAL